MDTKGKMKCLILFSGGVDSTVCVHYFLKQGFSVECIFIDYGQIARNKEFESVKNITSYYGIKLNYYKFGTQISNHGEIIGRNAFLILSAILSYPDFHGILSLGIHSGATYYDCSESFVKDINKILEGYTGGEIILDTPLLRWDKRMIYLYCKDNNIPIHLTYSCENGNECGTCQSCIDRKGIYAN